MKKALSSSGTSVLAIATRRNTPEDTILTLYFFAACVGENLKFYIANIWLDVGAL
jgi:hypothetical protein